MNISLGTRISNFLKDRLTEVYLVSFPKAGRTWLRSILGYALAREYNLPEANVLDLWQLSARIAPCPRIRVTHACDPHTKAPSEISLEGGKYVGKRVIFLARDPRDLLVSLFHHEAYRRPALGLHDGPRSTSISELVDRGQGGLRSLVHFYNLWASPSGINTVHLFYEDLHTAPIRSCRLAFDHMGLKSLSLSSIRYGVEQSSFDRMRKREEAGAIDDFAMRVADVGDEKSTKVREGKVGGYKYHFTVADLERIESYLSYLREPFDRYASLTPASYFTRCQP